MAVILQKLREIRFRKLLSALKIIKLLKNWPDYFKEFFGFTRGKETLYLFRNGIKMYLKEHALNTRVFNEIWVYECYNPKGFEINPTDVVLDIGANYGNFTLYAALKAKNGKVYSFEPLEENFNLLKKNVTVNSLPNVKLMMKAVFNKKGVKDLFLAKSDQASHSFFIGNVLSRKNSVNKVRVDTIALKNFISEEKLDRINFLKMDCEGAEYEILSSLKGALNKIDKISMETHYIDDDRNVISLKNYLEKNGFRVTIYPNHETRFINLLFAKRRKHP